MSTDDPQRNCSVNAAMVLFWKYIKQTQKGKHQCVRLFHIYMSFVRMQSDRKKSPTLTLVCNLLHHPSFSYFALMELKQEIMWDQPCSHAAATFTTLYKDDPGQFNPTARHGKTLSLPIFTPSLIQTSPFFLKSHNAPSCPLPLFFFFSCSLISFLCPLLTPKNTLRQTACSLCKWSAFHAQSWMRS